MQRLLVLAAAILVVAPAARAATITVDVTGDVVAPDNHCSLREAVSAANSDSTSGGGECAKGSGADAIVLAAGPAYTLSGAARDNANVSGDLDVTTPITIQGAGASLTTIDASHVDRAIDVLAGGNLTIQGVTITGGVAPNGLNTGISGSGTDGIDGTSGPGSKGTNGGGGAGDPGENGGGIRNAGTLTILDSTVSQNVAGNGRTGGSASGGRGGNGTLGAVGSNGIGGAGGAGGSGGGIFSTGTLTLTRTVVTGNVAGNGATGGTGTGGQGGFTTAAGQQGGYGGTGAGGVGGAGGSGGGVAATSGALTIDQSSIRANTGGVGGHGGLGQGGLGGLAAGTNGQGGLGGDGIGGPGGEGGNGAGIRGFSTSAAQISRSLVDGNTGGTGGVGGTGNGTGGGPATGSGADGGTGGSGQGGSGGAGGSGAGTQGLAGSYVNDTVTANTTGTGGAGGASAGGSGGGSSSGTPGSGGSGTGGSGGTGGQGALATNGLTTVTHATVTANSLGQGGAAGSGTGSPGSAGAAGTAGAINALAQTTLANSIVAANGSPACQGPVTNAAHNISLSDPTCPGLDADPLLAPLADNGGPTLTRRPGAGSPAIDAVPATGAGCAATDQRLVLRPVGLGCDIGAYELAPPGLTVGDAADITLESATLHGMVNPNARVSSYHFEYGPTADYGSSTPQQDLPAGVDPVAVNAAITGLTPGTTYHVRLVGTNADGAAASADHTFTTASPPGGGPGGGGGGDTTAPVFLSASLKPKTFAVNRKGAREKLVAAKVKRGTTFRYRLSEAARVVFTIQRHKGKRFVQAKRFAKVSKAGANTKKFSGRIGKRALKPGRYRATLVATDAAKNRSKPKRLLFKVVR
jgi:CSLREA domain-containing protein